ncbi:MAG: acyl-ACP--UDP-N-acetylglucosamine O-acyltransferase [Methylocystaceae bacterium]|nr:acyl-ACP--UDP-N-acetylglucosamine O-acyltransferase [Methylocystaceae bacterium]
MTMIHPTAIIESGAKLHDGVKIGPFCHIGPQVEIGSNSILHAHVVITGRASIGASAQIFPFACVGSASQDQKAALQEGAITLGDQCLIRENVTINSGIDAGTRIGRGCVFLAGAHVAHDCRLGDKVLLANNVLLGGHVDLDDQVVIGGGAAIHQYVRIGAYAFIGGLAGVEGDVAPYALAGGNRAHIYGLNLIGLTRQGFNSERIATLKAVYRHLFNHQSSLVFRERLEEARRLFGNQSDVKRLLDFLDENNKRPICSPRRQRSVA